MYYKNPIKKSVTVLSRAIWVAVAVLLDPRGFPKGTYDTQRMEIQFLRKKLVLPLEY